MSQNQGFALGKPGTKNDDDVVIVSACRTAITKARRGAFAQTPVEDLLAAVYKEAIARAKIAPEVIGDIVVGSVLGPNVQRANEARMAQFFAGIPDSVPLHTLNRQCSSGIQACAHIAAAIKAGMYEVGLAAGVESMSTANMTGWEGQLNAKIFLNQQAKDCMLPMGLTSENVAKKWNVGRREQDELAARSNQLAIQAIKKGNFKKEIVPVTATLVDKKTGQKKTVVVDTDEGPRDGVTAQSLSKLKPAFDPQGATTAGNASQVSDGAAAVILMTRRKAKELGCPIIGVFRSFAVVGVPPAVMGIGPAYAIPAALKQCGLSQDDIDVYEINEAFASQALMSINHLKLPLEKINPNGGAIALGHPLGCTGARQVSTLLNELDRQRAAKNDSKPYYGVISMCIGSGMGAGAVLELE